MEERIRKEEEEIRKQALIEQERDRLRSRREASQERQKVSAASAIIIGNDLNNPNPVNNIFVLYKISNLCILKKKLIFKMVLKIMYRYFSRISIMNGSAKKKK